MAYIKEVIESSLFQEKIWYAHYTQTKAYLHLTILTIARAVLDKAPRSHRATVLIDGLNKTERHRVGAGLRDLWVKVEKVRGLSEKADALIRLADATAGFVRDALEGDQEMQQLFQGAVSRSVIKELK
ncbi:MAG: hypothetical protein HY731_03495 [Candidatus Tectomicrobia bacterium]|nr:hypothetical protein [Candidatus Tectomicrobia bacterium]